MHSFFLDLTPPILVRALRRFRNRNELNSAQVIAQSKAQHRLYDRFLPVLCRHIPPGWIVDVGANVGTTAKGMAKECDNPILVKVKWLIFAFDVYQQKLIFQLKALSIFKC